MPQYDIATVVFGEEVELLALQAKSIRVFGSRLSVNAFYIVVNGADQDRTIQRIKSEVLPHYGDRAGRVRIMPGRDLLERPDAHGWHSQQALKLGIAAHIESDWYVSLDPKNHLVRESDDEIFFDRHGVAYFHPASLRMHDMAQHYYKSAMLCGIDAEKSIDWCLPSITPTTLHRSHVIDLHKFLYDTYNATFEQMLCKHHLSITEYMIYDCYLRKLGIFEKIFTPGPRTVVTLWPVNVEDKRQFKQSMHDIEAIEVPFFSVHRAARQRLTEQQAACIAHFWKRIGLVDTEGEARHYLAPRYGGLRGGVARTYLGRLLQPSAIARKVRRVARVMSVGGSIRWPAGLTKELHVDRHGFVRQRKNGSMAVKIVDSDSTDSFKLRENLVALGRLLRPMKAIGYTKRRFGTRHQGGYVMLDDFKGIAAAFSLGVSSNVDWDMEVANRDIPVYQFGNSIEDVIIRHSRFKFYQGAIGPAKGQISFDALATEYAGEPLETASAIMKMDIEHGEWATLAAAAPKNLRKLRQFVVELHCMDLIAHPRWWLQAQAVLAKLHEEFCVVHVHGNVSGGALMVGGVPFPNVLEVTFASRHHYTFEETDELFPTPLDASCDPRLPDLYLGSFKF